MLDENFPIFPVGSKPERAVICPRPAPISRHSANGNHHLGLNGPARHGSPNCNLPPMNCKMSWMRYWTKQRWTKSRRRSFTHDCRLGTDRSIKPEAAIAGAALCRRTHGGRDPALVCLQFLPCARAPAPQPFTIFSDDRLARSRVLEINRFPIHARQPRVGNDLDAEFMQHADRVIPHRGRASCGSATRSAPGPPRKRCSRG
jgi:hypothetical protein